ncbi:MAG: M1 family metallopeptidase [Clostridiales bacterium]|nr:M1 family metallopeptidase [Clostridiales bacterium]
MRKKLTAIILAAALALSLLGCAAPEKIQRSKYTIKAELSNDYTLNSSVVCDYVNNNDVPLKELWFHLYPNAYRSGAKYSPVPSNRIAEAYPDGRSYSVLDVTSVKVNGKPVEITLTGEDENILSVALGRTLDPAEKISVAIDYTVKLPKVKHRFGYTDKSVNLANFYPIACMYRNGAFVADPYYSTGDPFFSDCADYSVTLTVPNKFEGAFTGTVKSKTSGESATTYNVEAKNVRDFAAVLGEYQKMSGLAGDVIVNYLYYNDGDPERALNTAIDAVKIFGNLFGAYPYKEYTVVQTGFLQGGMEYPCLSMISDAYSGDAKLDIIVHETAHQWWYGVVGNDEVKYSWLDEGLAEYSTMMFYEHSEGYNYTFNAKRADALGAYILYCETYKDNGMGDTSMTRAINEYEGETEYSYLVYVKGALMLDDVRNTVGTNSFISGLKRYYSENKYGIAEPQNLIGAMEKSSKRSLNELFDSWLEGNVKLFSSGK